MAEVISLRREDAIRALRSLELIVVSLDRLGSAAADMTKEEYDRASSEFLTDWDVARRLAEVRKLLSERFADDDPGGDELEKALDGTPHWTAHRRKPPIESI